MQQLEQKDALHERLLGSVSCSLPSLCRLGCSQSQSRAYGWLGKRDSQEGVDPGLLPLHTHILTSQVPELSVNFRCCQNIVGLSRESECDASRGQNHEL